MSGSAKICLSPVSLLRALGEGSRIADLRLEAFHLLEKLEADTARLWGMPVSSCHEGLPAKCRLFQLVYPAFAARRQQLQLSPPLLEGLWQIYLPLAQWVLAQSRNNPGQGFVLGVNGAQGSGKSTLCALLQTVLETGFKQQVAVLSLDDFYLTRAERRCLARRVHPLFVTRGVPGTHDVALAIRVLSALRTQGSQASTRLPVFAKALDDRLPRDQWPAFQGRADIILFEGWCVGARSEPQGRLNEPVNLLEAKEDPGGVWRRYVNQVLGERYPRLFDLLDGLLFLKIPGFRVVYEQRLEQEQQLTQALCERPGKRRGLDEGRAMERGELQRFIMHFQRLTEYMLDEMPAQADLVLELDEYRRFQSVTRK